MYKGGNSNKKKKTIADTHSAVNRVAYLLATENYYMVFIEGVLLQRHSASGTKKHDVPGRCWYVMGKFYIRSRWLLAITSQPWSKKRSKLHLNTPILKASEEETQGIWVLVAKASKRGCGHGILARSFQRNHGCEFLAKAHNGGYTQSNLQRSHDQKSLERICRKVIATIICCRRYLGSNCACGGTKSKKMHEPHDGASTPRESDIKPIQLSHMLRG